MLRQGSGTWVAGRPAPTFAENGQLGVEIVFGSGRLYAAFDERSDWNYSP